MTDEAEKTRNDRGGRSGDGRLIHPKKPTFFENVRSNFLAGIVVAAPIGITIWFFYWLFTGPLARLDSLVKRTLPFGDSTVESVLQILPGVGVIVAFLFIVTLGALAKNFIGRSLIRIGERLFESVPFVRNVFGFVKNVFDTALRQSERSFKDVALIEYPRLGSWAIAFVVGDAKGEVGSKLNTGDEALTALFVPTVPNPTSGFLLFIPKNELKPLSMSVEEAMKMVFSLGLVVPDFTEPGAAVKKVEALAKQANDDEAQPSRLRRLFSFGAKD